MHFFPEHISEYAEHFTAEEPPLLRALNRETQAKVLYPQMLCGHLQGRLLSFISKMIVPRYIVEIGTYTGYSALCLAEGLRPGGKLVTIDNNEELVPMCKKYFQRAGMNKKIILRTGNARKISPLLKGNIDLALIDADKENYVFYYETLFPKIRKGGVLIADNVLWSGKVTDERVRDKDTRGIRAFNERVKKDSRAVPLLLPVRDGLMLIQKK